MHRIWEANASGPNTCTHHVIPRETRVLSRSSILRWTLRRWRCAITAELAAAELAISIAAALCQHSLELACNWVFPCLCSLPSTQ
jgi:hypothetical protein